MRPHPLTGSVVAVLVSTCACAASEPPTPAGVDAQGTALVAERAIRVLEPMVRGGLAEIGASRAADLARLHVPTLEGVEVDLALDALAGAVEGRPTESGLDLAGKWFLARVRAHRQQARAPGLAWGGGFRLASLATGPSPAEQAAASLRGVEESLAALQAEVGAVNRRRLSQRPVP